MRSKWQRGAQAVEFALVLPFLVLVIFTVLDFGILVYNKAIITNASREAARRGITLNTGWNVDDIRAVACRFAKDAVISVGGGTHTSTCTGTADPVITVTPAALPGFNQPVTVTVTYNVRGFTLGTWWSLGSGSNAIGSPFTLVATTQMNHE